MKDEKLALLSSTSSDFTLRAKSTSLSLLAADIESICDQIEAVGEGEEIPFDLIASLQNAKTALSTKVDNWIGYLDTMKAMLQVSKDRKDRATRSHRVLDRVFDRMKDYLKFVLEGNSNLPMKGAAGRLYLQKNADSKLCLSFDLRDVSIRNVMPSEIASEEILQFTKTETYLVLDTQAVKQYLKAGAQLSWAYLDQGHHVRYV